MQPFSNLLEKCNISYEINNFLSIDDEKKQIIDILKYVIIYEWKLKNNNIPREKLENISIAYIDKIKQCIFNCTSKEMLHNLNLNIVIPTFEQVKYIKNKQKNNIDNY